jgi:outer membrane biosynthesis protein TonB
VSASVTEIVQQPEAQRVSPLRSRPTDRVHIVVGALVALAMHGFLVGVVYVFTYMGQQNIEKEIEPKMLKFDDVQLLALGEEKPEEALPRIANPEPAVKPPEEVNLAQPDEPVVELEKPEPKEEVKEDKDAREQKMLDALSALHNPNRPTNDELPEGSSEGVVGGTVSDAALANLMGTYQAKLLAEIAKVWQIPSTLTDDEIKELSGQVAVYVRLSDDGYVVSYNFERSSSNEQFNGSIERVLRRFQVSGGRKLPLPDNEEIRQMVLREGLNLVNWTSTVR